LVEEEVLQIIILVALGVREGEQDLLVVMLGVLVLLVRVTLVVMALMVLKAVVAVVLDK
jgi:hypothetical protein